MAKTTALSSVLLGTVKLLTGTADPSSAGLVAPLGSKYWRSGVAGDYTKTGAGDTAWTLTANGIYFNVKDYGATGDGTTDDRTTIQLAITDAEAAGGTVFFPPGTYKCGKSGANPYSFLLDGTSNVRFLGCGPASVIKQSGSAATGAYNLFRLSGGCNTVEFELLTFSQAGLTSPGENECHLIKLVEAEIVKFIHCKFTGGVATAGAYVHMGGTADLETRLVWVQGCDMRNAGGPIVWIDGGVNTVWLLDNDMVNTATSDETILVADTVDEDISDIKILNNHIENTQKYALRVTTSGLAERFQVSSNLLLGFVSCTTLQKSQFQHNEVYVSVAAITDPVVLFADCTYQQCQKNVIGRASTAADGLVAKFDTCLRSQVQSNDWVQETTGATSGLVHILDCSTCQFGGNNTRTTDAGASITDAYLVEAVAVVADNLQFSNEQVTALAGTWLSGIRVKYNGANVGAVQLTGGVIRNVATGVLFDDNSGGAGVFTSLLMVAGGLIEASTAAYSVTVAGVYVRVGTNASTFGAQMIAGAGTPEGAVTARIGSLFLRSDGGASTTLYVKQSGTGNTGWVAK